MVGAWAGHVAVRDAPWGAGARRSHWLLAALMVVLTTVTLWSLGQAIVKESGAGDVGDMPATQIGEAQVVEIGVLP